MKNINLLFLAFFLFSLIVPSMAQSWEKLGDFPGGERERMFTFVLNDIIYTGMGRDGNGNKSDIWAFNPSTRTWTQKADFPGPSRRNAAAFAIGSSGYVLMGYPDHASTLSDFWRYNPNTDTWTQLDDFPSPGRNFSNAFSYGGKGYIIGGKHADDWVRGDVWEYNPATNSWTELTSCPGPVRWMAFGFKINGKIYWGGGVHELSDPFQERFTDFWEYDIASDSWTRKADFPSEYSIGGAHFSLGNRGYVCEGVNSSSLSDYGSGFWMYDTDTDTWTSLPGLTGGSRIFSFYATVNGRAYTGTGRNYSNGAFMADVFMLNSATTDTESTGKIDGLKIYPNPSKENVTIEVPSVQGKSLIVEISDAAGKTILAKKDITASAETMDISHLPKGIYMIKTILDKEIRVNKFIKL